MKASEPIPRKLPRTFACPECKCDFECFDKLKSSKKLVKDLVQTHSCKILIGEHDTPTDGQTLDQAPQDDDTMKRYDIAAMLRHIETECPKTRTCFQCKITFDTISDFATHLKYACEHIKVRCNLCEQNISRAIFKTAEHRCYSSGQVQSSVLNLACGKNAVGNPFAPVDDDSKVQELENVIDMLTKQLAKPCTCDMKQFYDLFEQNKIEKEHNGIGLKKTCMHCSTHFDWDYVRVFPSRDQFCSVKCAFNNFILKAKI